MEKMIAFCGIICTECPAYLAIQKDNDNERKKVAEMWSKQFKSEIKPEDINCDGCLKKSGRLFGYCNECPIRKCAMERNISNCAYCDDYPCEELNKFHKFAPDAKATLETIRETM
ncbi:MAG: DUF3795 domain-containing protein [Candidatus Cloacimonadota bacterium]|nr:DUF3795 domain-containing protein [Candidatus Cloacimonadota bacterium]